MIKILFYIDELTAGGAEKVLCNLVNNMDPSSFDITVHTTWKSDAESLLKPHVKYKYVYSNKNKINRYLYRAETQLGLFYQLHLKDNYDIEVAYLECGPTKVMASSTNKKAAHIAWIHCDLEKKFTDMNAFADKTRSQYKKYDKVICVSEECNKTYQKYFSDCAPSQVLYNVIDDEEIQRKAELAPAVPINKTKLTAIAVGRMTDQKNYMMLLEAYNELRKEGKDFDLWFVGDGPDSNKLKSYVKGNGLEGTVRFYGFQSNPYPYIKKADFLICSSKYEGYSTVAVEAMILGTPIVTVDCTGMEEIIGDPQCGLIVDNSKEGLKVGISQFLLDYELRNSLSEKALARSVQLSGKNVVKLIEQILEYILEEKQKWAGC